MRGLLVDVDGLAVRLIDPVDDVVGEVAAELALDAPRFLAARARAPARRARAVGVDEDLARPRHGGEPPDEIVLDALEAQGAWARLIG